MSSINWKEGGTSMAGIWNINSINDINAKKILRKLSFNVGENFSARVINLDKLTGEVLLKLLDGWQFSAKLQNNVDALTEGLIRFEVEGFEDGKILLKILNSNEKQQNTEKSSIETLLKEKGISVGKEDYPLLDKMIKHNIPLTRENISNIKTLVDFQNKIKLNNSEENIFIDKYMQGKGIDPNSNEGSNIKNTLKGFLNELKNISQDDIITLFENNVDLTEENIKSFNSVFKGSSSIYSDIKELKDKLLNIISSENISYQSSMSDAEINIQNTNDNLGIIKDKNSIDIKDEMNNKQTINSNNTENVKTSLVDEVILNNNEKAEDVLNKGIKKEYSIDDIAKNIKDQVSNKTEEIKNIIKTVLEQKNETKPEAYNNLIQTLDKSINDFKVFNSISNQYYYLDLPVNFANHEYGCKLMIKDERKRGKKIDSTDVKIAASVNTIHMGVVDAYIKVKNSNMDIDIKCEEKWVKLLEIGKDKILSGLSSIGYNIYIKVDEKVEEMNITNCREFFGDNNLGMINVKV